MYGRHFSKRLFEYAVSKMIDRNGNRVSPVTKEQFDEKMKANGIQLKNNIGYDAAYVWQMATADYFGSSVVDEAHLAKFVRDFVDDIDGYDTKAFDHYYADCIATGCPIFWSEVL